MTGARLPHKTTGTTGGQNANSVRPNLTTKLKHENNYYQIEKGQAMPDPEALLSKSVVMSRLGIGEKAVRRLINQRRLPVIKFGKTSPLKFRQLDVARFLESSVANPLSASRQ
jgi:hypothetical protein